VFKQIALFFKYVLFESPRKEFAHKAQISKETIESARHSLEKIYNVYQTTDIKKCALGIYDILELLTKGKVKPDKDMNSIYPFVSTGISYCAVFILREKYKGLRAKYYDKSIHTEDSRVDESKIEDDSPTKSIKVGRMRMMSKDFADEPSVPKL